MISMKLMGEEHLVPFGLTIMAAIEYAGYKLVRGVGCRAGFCGACPAIYHKANDYKLYTALACQTLVEDGMCLVQIPFVPLTRKMYNLAQIRPTSNIILQYYPEVARCVSCNTCTRACPQNVAVMDYIQAALRSDFERAAHLSFDCIQCGICSSRCPADIKHYHVAQVVRRLHARYIMPPSQHLTHRIQELESGMYATELDTMMQMSLIELKHSYENRTFEQIASQQQKHSDKQKWGTLVDPIDFQDDINELAQPNTC